VRVRLTRQLADELDGIDLSGYIVGDVIDLPNRAAELLMAERWALLERRLQESLSTATPRRRTDDLTPSRPPRPRHVVCRPSRRDS
jgi:hypothetical protein